MKQLEAAKGSTRSPCCDLGLRWRSVVRGATDVLCRHLVAAGVLALKLSENFDVIARVSGHLKQRCGAPLPWVSPAPVLPGCFARRGQGEYEPPWPKAAHRIRSTP